MATYVHDKARSPYWLVKFKGPHGRYFMRSTKETNERLARKKGDAWEEAARMAARGELTQAASVKVLGDLMKLTIGETLHVESVEKYLTDWLAAKDTNGRAGSTVKRYKPVIEGFIKSLPELRRRASVGTVTTSEVERFRDAELKDGKGHSTANFAVRVLRAAFSDARRRGLALSNPAEAVNIEQNDSEERQPFTDDETRSLLQAAEDGEWKGAILFGAWGGMRLSDVAALTWQNIDLTKRTATFEPQKTRRTVTGSKRRLTIALHPEIVAWLRTREQGVGAAPIFPSLHGRKSGSAGGLSNAFSALMTKAAIVQVLGVEKKGKGRRFRGKGFHSFRHSFVSRLAAADVSPDVRKLMVGHSSDEIHDRYTHLDVSAQERALAKLPALGVAK